jgi:hypothetical protein
MDLRDKELQSQKTNAEIGLKRADYLGGAYGDLVKNPTLDNARGILSNAVSLGILTPQHAEQQFATLSADPSKIAELAQKGVLASISAKEKLANATQIRGQDLTHSASMASVGATMRGQDITDKRMREEIGTLESATGPNTYKKFGPDAGVLRPMAQATFQPPSVPAVVPSAQGGALGTGTYGMGAPNTLPATVGATTTRQTNMLGQTPPTATGGYTQAQPKGPNSVINVNTNTTASEEAQKEFMKSSRVTYDQLKQASTVLDNIERAKVLVPTAKGFMGTGGETMLETAKFMNNRLGTSIDTTGIKSAEELNSRLFIGIMDNLKKMDAQPSQQQQAAMKQALGSLGTDPNAMNSVLDVFGDIVRGKVDIHNAEVTGAEARGVKFPYNPVIKLPERTAPAAAPVYATNGKDRIMSTDGGKTWNPVGAK